MLVPRLQNCSRLIGYGNDRVSNVRKKNSEETEGIKIAVSQSFDNRLFKSIRGSTRSITCEWQTAARYEKRAHVHVYVVYDIHDPRMKIESCKYLKESFNEMPLFLAYGRHYARIETFFFNSNIKIEMW